MGTDRAPTRLVAGFCWPWSDPDEFGQLVPDVTIGDWSMPWNAKAEARRLGPGIPKSDFWASAGEGIDQVGCVYTAQGFEFGYVNVNRRPRPRLPAAGGMGRPAQGIAGPSRAP